MGVIGGNDSVGVIAVDVNEGSSWDKVSVFVWLLIVDGWEVLYECDAVVWIDGRSVESMTDELNELIDLGIEGSVFLLFLYNLSVWAKSSNCLFMMGACWEMRRASLMASLYLSGAFAIILVFFVRCSLLILVACVSW